MDNSELRILFVVDAIQGRNGVGTYFQDLAEQLRSSVAQVELVAPDLLEPHSVQGFSIPLPGDHTQRLFFPKMRKLIQLAKQMKPHVIVVPGPGLFATGGLWLAAKLGIPVCMTHQTDYPSLVRLYWPGRSGYLAQKSLSWINRFMLRASSSVVTISDGMVEQLLSLGVDQPYLVGTSLSNNFISRPLSPQADKIKKVLFLGRLAAEKNIAHFLNLAASRSDLTFTIAGDGPLRDSVIQQQEKITNLHFLGWQNREKIPQLIDGNDLLILPSSVEAFGTVALEAMVRERLVLTTSSCGISEWADLSRGLVVMSENESLHSALKRIEAMAPLERQKIARDGRASALALNQASVNQWLAVLRRTSEQSDLLPQGWSSPTYTLFKRYKAA